MSAELRVAASAELMTRDEFAEWCDRYFHRKRLDPRNIAASAFATGTDPTILDFGAIPPGLAFAVTSCNFFGGNAPGSSFPAIAGALCIGRPPISGGIVNPGDVLMPLLPQGTNHFNGKTWIGRAGQHFYLAVYGDGASASTFGAGSITNPGGGAQIASTPNLAPGTYQIAISTTDGSTPPTIGSNFGLWSNATPSLVISGLGPPVPAAGASQSYTFTVINTRTQGYSVRADSADNAGGSIYQGTISSTLISGASPATTAATPINATLGGIFVPDTLEALAWL